MSRPNYGDFHRKPYFATNDAGLFVGLPVPGDLQFFPREAFVLSKGLLLTVSAAEKVSRPEMSRFFAHRENKGQ